MAAPRPTTRRLLWLQVASKPLCPSHQGRSFATAVSEPTAPIAIQLHRLSHNLPQDTTRRKEIYNAARELMFRTENRKDALHRLTDAHELNNVAQVGVDLGIFRILTGAPDETFHIQRIAADSKADNALLLRILRFLAANGMLEQVTETGFRATNLTLLLADPDSEYTIRMNTLIFQPMMNKLPAFLKSTGYRNPNDGTKTVFQYHYETELPLFDWLRSHPEELECLHNVIGKMRVGHRAWTDVVPLADLKLSSKDVDTGRIFFVDVGGGTGHQSITVREKLPNIKGRIVLQDLPQVTGLIQQQQPEDFQRLNIETIAHDFFAPQPPSCRGAKIYFIRNVLHDWNDEKCIEILSHIRNAMAPDSVLMIDEMVLPDVGAKTRPMHYDIMLMATCGGVERTERQWRELLAKAGLRARDTYRLHEETHDCITIAVKA